MNFKGARPRACDGVKVINVIETRSIRGVGIDDSDPVRLVIQYWEFKGNLLAEKDPCSSN